MTGEAAYWLRASGEELELGWPELGAGGGGQLGVWK